MAEYMLQTEHLGISFSGLKAVQDVNLCVKKRQLYGLVGPNGAGKTTVFNLLTGVYQPTTGAFYLDGEKLNGKSQETINHKGIARTFQNIRLFNNMSHPQCFGWFAQSTGISLRNPAKYAPSTPSL